MKHDQAKKLRTYERVVTVVVLIGFFISVKVPWSSTVSKVLIICASMLAVVDIVLSVVSIKELRWSAGIGPDYVLRSPVRYILGSFL